MKYLDIQHNKRVLIDYVRWIILWICSTFQVEDLRLHFPTPNRYASLGVIQIKPFRFLHVAPYQALTFC